MKIRYLGTAAAEGVPGVFCQCALCQHARRAGGRDIRTRSQALVDEKLLIDFPPDTYLHALYGGLELWKIHSCLITHNHSDHLYPGDLEMRKLGFAHLQEVGAFTLYASEKTAKTAQATIDQYDLGQDDRVRACVLPPYQTHIVEGYQVTPLRASHDEACEPYIYLVGRDGKNMLYAHDTGVFPDETWAYLERERPYLAFASLDDTGMNRKNWIDHHMSLDTLCVVRDRLIKMGCADERTIWCVNHFSHNGGLTHEQLQSAAAEYGFLTSYDGMEVEF